MTSCGGAFWWNESCTECTLVFDLHVIEWVEDNAHDDIETASFSLILTFPSPIHH